MSTSLRQHVPDFVDGATPKTVVVTGIDAALAVPFVAGWRNMPGFHRFSVSGQCLMAEAHEGRKWWVVARVTGDPLDLPTWEAK